MSERPPLTPFPKVPALVRGAALASAVSFAAAVPACTDRNMVPTVPDDGGMTAPDAGRDAGGDVGPPPMPVMDAGRDGGRDGGPPPMPVMDAGRDAFIPPMPPMPPMPPPMPPMPPPMPPPPPPMPPPAK